MPYFAPIQEEQYPATDETQCLQVIVPAGDEFKALLAGLVVLATDVLNYANPDTPQADGLAAIWDEAYSQIDWEGCPVVSDTGFMTKLSLWHRYSIVDVNDAGNAVTVVHDTSQDFAHIAYQNPDTNNSQSSQFVRLKAGDWKMSCLAYKTAGSGKLQVYWVTEDLTSYAAIGSQQDLYAATTYNYVFTGTFTIPADGNYKITWSNQGKNASSSGYRMGITLTELSWTGD